MRSVANKAAVVVAVYLAKHGFLCIMELICLVSKT